jgi:hypothetical protein
MPPSSLNPFGSDAPEGEPDDDPSGQAESSPEEARAAAEDALARIEAMADLDDDPDEKDEPASAQATGGDPASGETNAAASMSDASATETDDGAGGGPPEDQCENCGALLDGPYCSQCGQRAADRIVPIWHMINEGLEAVIELDLRVLKTLPKFLFLPGRLTKEYLNGRRQRYIRPFRLYLFATFLLFTVLAFTATGGIGFPFPPAATTVPADSAQATTASMAPGDASPTDDAAEPRDTTAAPESLQLQNEERRVFGNQEERDNLANQIEQDTSDFQVNLFDDPATNERFEQILRRKSAQTVRNPWEFVGGMIDRGPYVMFLMLPIFAFFLKLLYIRRGRLYVEHMIFSLHVHAHAFFAFTVGILMGESDIGWVNTAAIFVELSPLLYILLAMRHVYEQGMIKTSLKAFLLFVMYSIVLSFGLIFLLLLSLLLM